MLKIIKCYFIATLILAGCGFSTALAQGLSKKNLIIGASVFPGDFHPLINPNHANRVISGFIQRPLTVFNEKNKIACMLCEKMPSKENGLAQVVEKDGETEYQVTLSLVKGLKWGDGKPLTTKDIMFTWSAALNAKSGFAQSDVFSKIKKITIHNDQKFTLHFDQELCDLSALNYFYILPSHVEKKIFDGSPESYAKNSLYKTQVTNSGLYNGPYIIEEVYSNKEIKFTKNPYWSGKDPYFENITLKFLGNTLMLEVSLLTGQVHYVLGELGLTIDKAKSLEKRLGLDYEFVYKPSLFYEKIDINHQNPILKDAKIRQALLHGINRNAITDYVFDGHQPIAQTCVSPLEDVCLTGIKHYFYEPEKAKKILDEAGWKEKDDGIRYNTKGKRLELEIMMIKGDRTQELVQKIIRDQLQGLGFFIVSRGRSYQQFFSEVLRKRQFKGLALYYDVQTPLEVPALSLHSRNVPEEDNSWSGENYSGYKNEQMDDILEKMQVTCDYDMKLFRWEQFQKLYAEELPSLPLYFRTQTYIIPRQLVGIIPTAHESSSTFWVENWHLR